MHPELAAAIRFRQEYGLRADEEWVRQVALDPTATLELGVPLLPSEKVAVAARARSLSAALHAVETYGGAFTSFAGAAVDEARGDLLVISFTDEPSRHAADVDRLVGSTVRYEIRQVGQSLSELQTLSRSVGQELAWFDTIGAPFISSRVDKLANQVRVEVSSVDDTVGPRVIEHFDALGRMYVAADGTGIALWPRGTLVVVIRDGDGNPMPGVLITATGDVPAAGTGDVGVETDEDGAWTANLPATDYEVDGSFNGERVVVGRATVVAGETTRIELVAG